MHGEIKAHRAVRPATPCTVLTAVSLKPLCFQAASVDEQRAILKAHPKIGAPKQSMSVMSRAEQSHGAETSGETLARLSELNDAYDEK